MSADRGREIEALNLSPKAGEQKTEDYGDRELSSFQRVLFSAASVGDEIRDSE